MVGAVTAPAAAPAVTRNCASGNHTRCLGTVHSPTRGLVPCECPTADCGHGTDTAKARNRRESSR